ncbi:hypothetical protein PCL_10830 [Purpureocillium lilacinum]|uniref:Uncharacterized protein n=1 Tax=Purpureocillium lilacinum TaxID=33203 RepID=A0A2U3ECH3_PURLI|nr:hypothetical protein PCL_10830 [Purpureocillium lilacinum]
MPTRDTGRQTRTPDGYVKRDKLQEPGVRQDREQGGHKSTPGWPSTEIVEQERKRTGEVDEDPGSTDDTSGEAAENGCRSSWSRAASYFAVGPGEQQDGGPSCHHHHHHDPPKRLWHCQHLTRASVSVCGQAMCGSARVIPHTRRGPGPHSCQSWLLLWLGASSKPTTCISDGLRGAMRPSALCLTLVATGMGVQWQPRGHQAAPSYVRQGRDDRGKYARIVPLFPCNDDATLGWCNRGV